MALLTAEDVLNKAFSKTKYREGFDQDEVDDFLDEVANAISALTAERDELQARLSQYQAGGAPVAAAAAPGPAAERPGGMSSTSADLLAAATDPNPPSATTMLSMAQKLHDDYVQAGEAERDRIIDEGKSKAESIVEQAETDARVRMQSLDSERADLERRIDDLRRFERDYRGHLRNYLENLLGDLEHNSARGGVSAPGVDAPDITTSGTEASGTDASGTEASGTDASGTDASGADASGTDASVSGASDVGVQSTTPEAPLFGGGFGGGFDGETHLGSLGASRGAAPRWRQRSAAVVRRNFGTAGFHADRRADPYGPGCRSGDSRAGHSRRRSHACSVVRRGGAAVPGHASVGEPVWVAVQGLQPVRDVRDTRGGAAARRGRDGAHRP